MNKLMHQLSRLEGISSNAEMILMVVLQESMASMINDFMTEHPDFAEKETVSTIITGNVEDIYLDEKVALAFSRYSAKDDVLFATLAAAYCYGLVYVAQRNEIHGEFACKMLYSILQHESAYRKNHPEYLNYWLLLAYMIDFESWYEEHVTSSVQCNDHEKKMEKSLMA